MAIPLLICLSCKTPPEPGELPATDLVFDRIEAESIHKIALYFTLNVSNPRSLPMKADIGEWQAELGGRVLGTEAAALFFRAAAVPPGETAGIPLRLDLDLEKSAADAGEIAAALSVGVCYFFDDGQICGDSVSAAASFPRIREPEFTITSIAIQQAELINTRFRVSLRIDNPNFFPVDLSSFGYELYGDGRFWAGGVEHDVLHIPARSSGETRLFLLMNFIDMRRSLLDEVIAMRLVRYRFRGEVTVGTGVDYLPRFGMAFDRSGMSEVFR